MKLFAQNDKENEKIVDRAIEKLLTAPPRVGIRTRSLCIIL